jgi:hypothetical protein
VLRLWDLGYELTQNLARLHLKLLRQKGFNAAKAQVWGIDLAVA